MLPNRTGANKLVNVTISHIDKDICDIAASDKDDDEDTNNNDLLHGVCDMKVVGSSVGNVAGQLVTNNVPTKMTIPQANEALIARRPSPIMLKTIASGQSDEDETDGCFGDQAESEHECITGINVKFEDLIYRARPGFSWDRCKYINTKSHTHKSTIFIIFDILWFYYRVIFSCISYWTFYDCGAFFEFV